MGSFFTNTSFIPTGSIEATVSSAMELLGYHPAENETELHLLNYSKWCTVHSEFIDEEQLHEALSKCADTVLTISCFDSDFMLLTLTHSGCTETVCVGEPYEGEDVEIQLTPEHWQPIVGNLDAFRSILNEDYIFAEESLYALAELFGFDAAQINVTPDELLEDPPEDMITLYYRNANPSEFEKLRSTLLKSIPQMDLESKVLSKDFSDALSKLTEMLFSATET